MTALAMARLQGTAALLVEFYEGRDTKQKAELNAKLSELRCRPETWLDALVWIESSPDMGSSGNALALYMAYFCASALEEAVHMNFGGAGIQGRERVRRALFAPAEADAASILLSAARGARPTLPSAVRTRMCKVFVDIGKAGWPHEMPSFLTDICAAAGAADEPTSALGLELLAITAEELCGAVRGMTARRSRQLKELVGNHLSQLVTLLTEMLRRGDTESRLSAEGFALRCLRTLVEWAPLAQHLQPELFATLFRLVERDLLASSKATAIGAVSVLEAVLDKKLVPPDLAAYVAQLAAHVLRLLRSLTDILDAQQLADDQDTHDFIGQVCELVATFVEQHLPRVLQAHEQHFPVADLLSLLAKLTFSRAVNEAGSLRRTLRPWEILVDFATDSQASTLCAATGHGVGSVLVSLLETRLLFAKNGEALEFLDDDEQEEYAGLHRTPVDDDADLLDLDEVVAEIAGGLPDPRALAGGRRAVGELAALLADAIALFANACHGAYSTYCADKLATAALDVLDDTLAAAFPSRAACSNKYDAKNAAIDAATLLYALAASAPHANDAVLRRAAQSIVVTAHGVLRERAYATGRAATNVAAAALDALRDVAPAAAYRFAGDCNSLVEGAVEAAGMALDTSVAPAPEAVQRSGAWLVLGLAKSSNRVEASLLKLSSLAGRGAWLATVSTPPRCRSLVYRAAATVSLAMAAREGRDAFEAINALVKPLAEPLESAAVAAASHVDALDAAVLDAAQRAARSFAALCAGFDKDGTLTRSALGRAFFGREEMPSCSAIVLAAAPHVLAYCASRSLRLIEDTSNPRMVRAVASARLPHLNCATATVDLLVAASRTLGSKSLAGKSALQAVSLLLAAFERASPAVAFERGGASGSRPTRAAALYLLKASCRLVAVVASDNDAKAAVPDACALATHHVAPLALDVNFAPDLLPAVLELCHRLLVDQWAAMIVRTNLNAPKTFRDHRAATHFDAILDLVLAGCRGTDLTLLCVRRAILVLRDAHAAHRLYDFVPFSTKWRPHIALAILSTLIDRRHDALADDLIGTLVDLCGPDHFAFCTHLLFPKLQQLHNLSDDQRNYISQSVPSPQAGPQDASTFKHWLQDAIADIFHFTSLNAPTRD